MKINVPLSFPVSNNKLNSSAALRYDILADERKKN